MEMEIMQLASKSDLDIPKMDITFSNPARIISIDSTTVGLRDRLKMIRNENPRLYRAFRTGHFD